MMRSASGLVTCDRNGVLGYFTLFFDFSVDCFEIPIESSEIVGKRGREVEEKESLYIEGEQEREREFSIQTLNR